MRVNRREFLQQLGGILAALGIGEAGWMTLTDRSQQVLAAPTRRKLALLIGINQYPEAVCDFVPPKGTALNGCLTDVELQRELLLHRFGFQPADILTLTDQQATRSAIESAFQSHLIDQAKSGDVVLFHFSGLGSRVSLGSDLTEQQIEQQTEQQSLVPIDGLLPTADSPIVNDLMLDTLLLLLRSLPTQQVITVLDTGFTHLGRINQGSLRIRSRPSTPSGQLLEAEQNLQTELFERLRLPPNLSLNPLRSSSFPGVMLTSSGFEQVSTEAQWGGFHAGLLTYALTQQLWSSTPTTTLDFCLRRAIGTVKQAAGKEQQPSVSSSKQLNLTSILASGLASEDAIGNIAGNTSGNITGDTAGNAIGADGFIRSIDDEGKVFLWLGGLPAIVLENVGSSLFAVVPNTPETQPVLLQVRSREGLLVKAKRHGDSGVPIGVGQPVQEVVRYLPHNPSLMIGLDASLARVERVDATSAFATIPQVSAVVAGEQSADLLFGKTQAEAATLTASLSLSESQLSSGSVSALTSDPIANKRGYGLFSLDRSAIYSTLNQDDEAVKTAVHRLTPQLRALLANKLLRLLENRGSSRLGVRATLLTTAPQERVIAQQESTRAPWKAPQSNPRLMPTPSLQVAIGSRIQYQMLNYSDRPLYFMAIGLDAEGLPVVYPPAVVKDSPSAPQELGLIAPGATRTLLQSDSETLVQAPGGIVETHLIFSRSPFAQAMNFLYSKLRIGATQRITNLANSLDLVQAILQDLQQSDSPADAYALDVNQWATFSFVYEVASE